MGLPNEAFDNSEEDAEEEIVGDGMESNPTEEKSEKIPAFEPESIEGFDVRTSPNQKLVVILDKSSSFIIFLFRLILAAIANISIIIGVGILYSVYILIIGGVFFGIYYTVTGKSEKISHLNETIQDLAEMTIDGFGKLFSGFGEMLQTISTSPFWQIVFISSIIIVSLNHTVRVGFSGLKNVANKNRELIIKIQNWAFEPLRSKQTEQEEETELESHEMTVVQLKDSLREVGLPVSGNKEELVARLDDYFKQKENSKSVKETDNDENLEQNTEHFEQADINHLL